MIFFFAKHLIVFFAFWHNGLDWCFCRLQKHPGWILSPQTLIRLDIGWKSLKRNTLRCKFAIGNFHTHGKCLLPTFWHFSKLWSGWSPAQSWGGWHYTLIFWEDNETSLFSIQYLHFMSCMLVCPAVSWPESCVMGNTQSDTQFIETCATITFRGKITLKSPVTSGEKENFA